MANTILTPTMIANEALDVLENNLVFTKGVNRQYEDRYAVVGGKIGSTFDVRLPAKYTVTSGAALSTQDHTETKTTITVDQQQHVDVTFTTADMTLSLGAFSDRVLKPAMAALANKIDRDGLALYQNVYNYYGTPGTTPNAALSILGPGGVLDDEAVPRDGNRALVINPSANVSLVNAMTGFFNNPRTISDQFNDGSMQDMTTTLGFKIGMDQNIVSHTVGPLGGTPLVNGASQGITSGYAATTSLVTDGWTASAANRLKAGDIFTIAGVNAVNPQSRQSTGVLRRFVVTADASSDGSGNLTAIISPAIISGGAFQTVSAAPADNAAITVVGTASTAYPQNLAYHRDAFTLATVDLEDVAQYGAWGARRVYKGISLRVARQYAIGTDTVPCRIDVLYGWKTIRPELACRLWG